MHKKDWDDKELPATCQKMLRTIQDHGVAVGKDAIEAESEAEKDGWEDGDKDVEIQDFASWSPVQSLFEDAWTEWWPSSRISQVRSI